MVPTNNGHLDLHCKDTPQCRSCKLLRMEHAAFSTQSVFITSLPNEVLLEIFSYLPPVRVTSLFFPHLRSTRSTILALRHTCRRFRTIVVDPKFWCTDDGDGPALT